MDSPPAHRPALNGTNKRKNRPNQTRNNRTKSMIDRDVVSDGIYANSRFVHSLATIVGCVVQLETKTGALYEGVFRCFSPQFEIVLEAAHKVTDNVNELQPEAPTDCDASAILSIAQQAGIIGASTKAIPTRREICPKMIFKCKDVTTVLACGVDLEYATKGDTFVESGNSKYNGQFSERELEPWDGGMFPEDDVPSLENDNSNGWDVNEMFRTNEQQYGVQSTYDNTLSQYTTTLASKNTDEYKKREQQASKIASEIESSATYRARIAIEDGDEDEKLSSVVRPVTGDGPSTNRYLPPAKRKNMPMGPMNRSVKNVPSPHSYGPPPSGVKPPPPHHPSSSVTSPPGVSPVSSVPVSTPPTTPSSSSSSPSLSSSLSSASSSPSSSIPSAASQPRHPQAALPTAAPRQSHPVAAPNAPHSTTAAPSVVHSTATVSPVLAHPPSLVRSPMAEPISVGGPHPMAAAPFPSQPTMGPPPLPMASHLPESHPTTVITSTVTVTSPTVPVTTAPTDMSAVSEDREVPLKRPPLFSGNDKVGGSLPPRKVPAREEQIASMKKFGSDFKLAESKEEMKTEDKDKSDMEMEKITNTLKKSTLNPNAKEFVMNPNAKAFTPRSPTTQTPTPPQTHTPSNNAPTGSYQQSPLTMMPTGSVSVPPPPHTPTGLLQAPPMMSIQATPPQYMVPGSIAVSIPSAQFPVVTASMGQQGPTRYNRKGSLQPRHDFPPSVQVAAATGQPILAQAALAASPASYVQYHTLAASTAQAHPIPYQPGLYPLMNARMMTAQTMAMVPTSHAVTPPDQHVPSPMYVTAHVPPMQIAHNPNAGHHMASLPNVNSGQQGSGPGSLHPTPPPPQHVSGNPGNHGGMHQSVAGYQQVPAGHTGVVTPTANIPAMNAGHIPPNAMQANHPAANNNASNHPQTPQHYQHSTLGAMVGAYTMSPEYHRLHSAIKCGSGPQMVLITNHHSMHQGHNQSHLQQQPQTPTNQHPTPSATPNPAQNQSGGLANGGIPHHGHHPAQNQGPPNQQQPGGSGSMPPNSLPLAHLMPHNSMTLMPATSVAVTGGIPQHHIYVQAHHPHAAPPQYALNQ